MPVQLIFSKRDKSASFSKYGRMTDYKFLNRRQTQIIFDKLNKLDKLRKYSSNISYLIAFRPEKNSLNQLVLNLNIHDEWILFVVFLNEYLSSSR